jgi:hypothetical protein
MVSGLAYCKLTAVCNPNDPAVSLKKQATQSPILPGLPQTTSATETTATNAPVKGTSSLSKVNFFSIPNILPCFAIDLN